MPEDNTIPITTRVEKLDVDDKNLLDNAKFKAELAKANAKTAIAQSESADLAYNNTVLQLALKYKLEIGSVLELDGTIRRKAEEK